MALDNIHLMVKVVQHDVPNQPVPDAEKHWSENDINKNDACYKQATCGLLLYVQWISGPKISNGTPVIGKSSKCRQGNTAISYDVTAPE